MPVNGSRQLRQQLRSLRRGISPRNQRLHSLSISKRIARSPSFQHSRRIAFYLSADGEIDLSPVIERAQSAGKRCFLPVLRRRPALSLWFTEYDSKAKLKINRFGICEPVLQKRKVAMPWGLDLILVPLVGFDLRGNRIGMGGGYYDRTLSYLRHRRYWRTPPLIGVAHECQKVDALIATPWDIPLDAVVTENAFYPFE
jgi:5-formyltetrahydrofolate cyclo-ligase